MEKFYAKMQKLEKWLPLIGISILLAFLTGLAIHIYLNDWPIYPAFYRTEESYAGVRKFLTGRVEVTLPEEILPEGLSTERYSIHMDGRLRQSAPESFSTYGTETWQEQELGYEVIGALSDSVELEALSSTEQTTISGVDVELGISYGRYLTARFTLDGVRYFVRASRPDEEPGDVTERLAEHCWAVIRTICRTIIDSTELETE